jgi:hypothetical protein
MLLLDEPTEILAGRWYSIVGDVMLLSSHVVKYQAVICFEGTKLVGQLVP